MSGKKVLDIILGFISAFLFVVGGALTITLCIINGFTYANMMLGIILVTVSCIKVAHYFLTSGYKDKHNLTLALSVPSLALGIIFLVNKVDISIMCFVWGFYELTSSCIEIQMAANEIKHNKIEIMEIVIEIATIVFAILLCIKLDHGLTGHLIFLSISLFLYAIMVILEMAPLLGKKNKEKTDE